MKKKAYGGTWWGDDDINDNGGINDDDNDDISDDDNDINGDGDNFIRWLFWILYPV